MSEIPPEYFIDRDRSLLPREWVETLPFPLAVTAARLADGLERNEPVAAAWLLRDAFEALLKFCASAAVADVLQAKPAGPLASAFASLLLKPQGLSLGDWHSLLYQALEPVPGSGPEGRVLPELAGLMFQPKTGRRTPVARLIDGDEHAFIRWRNRVFGHGVFRNDPAWYAGEVKLWLPKLRQFHDALIPALAGWRLVSAAGEAQSVWQGTHNLPPSGRHMHEPSGEPTPMVLTHDDGRVLPFGPMLSTQACARCGQPAAFFFDKNRFDREKDRHRTTFLEYFGGHDQEQKDWPQTRALASCLPPSFVWEREVFDPDEIAEGVRIVFLGFETEYRRPDYLLDAVWEAIEDTPKGRYVFIGGPEGVGKTYAVRGLEREAPERDSAVLLYHVLPNESGNYQTFMSSLNDRAKEHLKLRTPDIQARGASTPESLQAEFCDYLDTLRRGNKLDRLVVVLDALDELPEPDPRTPAITDFLPPAEKLPDRCAVVLTSRDPLHPRTRRDVDRLRESGGDAFIPLRVDPSAAPNRELLRAYLLDPEADRLPAGLRSSEHADLLISRAGGAFLYVFHLSRALCSGAFPDLASLPEGPSFYPSYLARLRDRVGPALYDSVYLPTLLLLAAAYQPVTLRQLHRWGVSRDRLAFALLDLRDFLRVHRVRLWHDSLADSSAEPENRYEIAHEEFLRYVRTDADLSRLLQDSHTRIGLAALPAPPTTWKDLDPTDDGQLYDLRNALPHLEAAGRPDEREGVRRDWSYALACGAAGEEALRRARFHIARDLCERAERVCRHLVDAEARREFENDLATAVMNQGVALYELGRFEAAAREYDRAVQIRTRLVEVDGRRELEDDLAAALMNKGVALDSLGRHEEAVREYDRVIAIETRLVEAEGRRDIENGLATTSMNRGVSLHQIGRHEEAARDLDRAVEIRARIAEAEGGAAEADLATALVNRGVNLKALGRSEEAARDYDRAIEIRNRLIDAEGRRELEDDLASVLMNKGVVLAGLGRADEALRHYDRAIEIRTRLVDAEGRRELGGELGMALANKANLLVDAQAREEALDHYEAAVRRWEECVRSGMPLPLLLIVRTGRYKLRLQRDLGRWEDAAAEVVRLIDHAQAAFAAEQFPPGVREEVGQVLGLIRDLPEEAWERLAPGLGRWKEGLAAKRAEGRA